MVCGRSGATVGAVPTGAHCAYRALVNAEREVTREREVGSFVVPGRSRLSPTFVRSSPRVLELKIPRSLPTACSILP